MGISYLLPTLRERGVGDSKQLLFCILLYSFGMYRPGLCKKWGFRMYIPTNPQNKVQHCMGHCLSTSKVGYHGGFCIHKQCGKEDIQLYMCTWKLHNFGFCPNLGCCSKPIAVLGIYDPIHFQRTCTSHSIRHVWN